MAYASRSKAIELVPRLSTLTATVVNGALAVHASVINHKLGSTYAVPLSVSATGAVAMAAPPTAGEAVVIGDKTYTFRVTPSVIYDVTIGGTAAASAANLCRAIMQQSGGGYFTGTLQNDEARATVSGSAITLYAREAGPDGNSITLTTTAAGITLTAFTGGLRYFDELACLNGWLAGVALLAGQTASASSGTGTGDSLSALRKLADDMLATLMAGPTLYDSTGAAYSTSSTGGMLTDCDNYPIADSGDPTGWGHDSDRDYSRE